MTKTIQHEYKRQRSIGNSAVQALRAAKVRDEFEALESIGKVRLNILPDDSPDLSFLDQKEFASVRQREYDRANTDRVWGMIGEYRCPACSQWQHANSVWGFIGEDWRDSGYDIDIMQSTINAYYKACL